MPKMTIQEFAAKIKKQYPAYAKISDDELAQRMIQKFPQYGQQVDYHTFGGPKPSSNPLSIAGNFAKGAIVNPIKAGLIGARDIAMGGIYGHEDQDTTMGAQGAFERGKKAWEEGNKGEAIARMAASAVPMAGPGVEGMAERAGTAAGEGDYNALAEAAGEAASPAVLPALGRGLGRAGQAAANLPMGRIARTAAAVAGEAPIVGPAGKRMLRAGRRAWEGSKPQMAPPPSAEPGMPRSSPTGPVSGGPSPAAPPIDIELPPPPQAAGRPAGPSSSPTGPVSAPPQGAAPPVDISLPPPPKAGPSRPAGPTTSSPGGPPIDIPVEPQGAPRPSPAGPQNSPSGPTSGPPSPPQPPIDLPVQGMEPPPQGGSMGSKPNPQQIRADIQRVRSTHPDWSLDEVLAYLAEERMAPTNTFNEPGKLRAGDRWGWRTGETTRTPTGEVVEPRSLSRTPPSGGGS